MEDNNLIKYKIGLGDYIPIDITKIQDSKDNLIDLLHSNKLNSIKEDIRQIVRLIKERKDLHHKVLSDIEREIIRVRDIISGSCESVMRYNTVELKPTREDLEESIIKLEKAMIDEKVAAWRDVLGLKKDLIKLKKDLKLKLCTLVS